PDLIDETVSEHGIAFPRDIHVAYDIAAARDAPGLEFLGLGIEPYDGVRLGEGLAVPHGALGEHDAVGLGLRSARRLPLDDFAGSRIEPAQEPAREIRVPDDVVGA